MTKRRMTMKDLLDEITLFLAMTYKIQNCVRDRSGAPFFRLFSRRKRAGTNSPTLGSRPNYKKNKLLRNGFRNPAGTNKIKNGTSRN